MLLKKLFSKFKDEAVSKKDDKKPSRSSSEALRDVFSDIDRVRYYLANIESKIALDIHKNKYSLIKLPTNIKNIVEYRNILGTIINNNNNDLYKHYGMLNNNRDVYLQEWFTLNGYYIEDPVEELRLFLDYVKLFIEHLNDNKNLTVSNQLAITNIKDILEVFYQISSTR